MLKADNSEQFVDGGIIGAIIGDVVGSFMNSIIASQLTLPYSQVVLHLRMIR